MLNKITYLFN